MLAYIYLQNAKWDRAVTVLRALQLLAPNDAHVAKCLAYAYLEIGDDQAALREATTGFATVTNPADAEAGRLLQARAWWRLGLIDQAHRLLANRPA